MSEEERVHLSRSAPKAYLALSGVAKTAGYLAAEAGIDPALKELVQIHASQLNKCAYCVRIHFDRAVEAGVSPDTISQIPVWRESGVFSERERAALELAESFTLISQAGIPDEVYDRVGGIFTEEEYVALSWVLISINAFNRVATAGRYAVPRLEDRTP